MKRACTLLLGLLALIMAPTAAALSYAVAENAQGQRVLIAYGAIKYGDEKSFSRVVAAETDIAEIWLASGGGNVHASYLIGRIIRQLKKPTRVPGSSLLYDTLARAPTSSAIVEARAYLRSDGAECSSACGMLLAGGMLRFVNEPYTVGLHSASAMGSKDYLSRLKSSVDADDDVALNDLERANQQSGVAWSRYMQEMGVSSEYVLLATNVRSGCMYYLSASELDELNVTNVRGAKTAGSRGPGKLMGPRGMSCTGR